MSAGTPREETYETVFLDVDGTLLWVDLDVEGYVADLAPYSSNGEVTVDRSRGPVWRSVRRHIDENINHRTREDLASFKRENASRVAREIGVEAPDDLLSVVADRRISFKPFPESEAFLAGLRERGKKICVVSNWDITLGDTLEELGWLGYFDAVVASAGCGSEKPAAGIFEEALRAMGETGNRERVVHVGNDPDSDIAGAVSCGLDAVQIARNDEVSEKATAVISDLRELFELPGFADG